MITATRNWLRRNRRNIAIGAGILGTCYVAGQYILGKINEARQRMSEDRIAKENLRRRFTQNQEDCTYTVLALLPTATENCLKAIPTEDILSELQARKSDKLARSTASSEIAPSDVPTDADEARSSTSGITGSYVRASRVATGEGEDNGNNGVTTGLANKTKNELWDDLKTTSITRAFTLIYTLALLTLLTRIQLNLLGRRTYLSSVVSLASPAPETSTINLENRDDDNMDQDYGNDFETNRKYLTFSWWLLHKGWAEVMDKVATAVREVFGVLSPRDNLQFMQLADLTIEVRRRVEGATDEERGESKWLQYLLPPRAEEEVVLRESGVAMSSSSSPPTALRTADSTISSSLRRLLDETSDLIDSPAFAHVLTLTLDAAFSLLVDDKVAVQAYKIPSRITGTANPSDTLSTSSRVQELQDDESESSFDPKHAVAKLATILAVFTRQAHAIGNGGDMNAMMASSPTSSPEGMFSSGAPQAVDKPNEYLAVMESVRDLEAFAAVVYSSNFEFEGADISGNIADVLTEEANGEQEGGEGASSDLRQSVKESFVEVRTELQESFESAWGKARAVVDDS